MYPNISSPIDKFSLVGIFSIRRHLNTEASFLYNRRKFCRLEFLLPHNKNKRDAGDYFVRLVIIRFVLVVSRLGRSCFLY